MPVAERERVLEEAREAVLRRLPSTWALYVYGSFAQGDLRPDSDLDLAVLLPPGEKIEDLLGLVAEVSSRVRREVDIVDLRRAGDFLRSEVLAHGRTLFAADGGRVLEWEGSALTSYAQHRERLRDIMAEFRRTGIGYGP